MSDRPFNGDELEGLDVPVTEEDFEIKEKYVKENLEEKIRSVNVGLRIVKHVIALFRYMLDENIPWYKKTIVAAALAYFIMPFDAIPDMIPFIGYLDDFGVIASVLAFLGKELKPYYFPAVTLGSQEPGSGS